MIARHMGRMQMVRTPKDMMKAANLALESQLSGSEGFAGTTNPWLRKRFFQEYKFGTATSESRLIWAPGYALVVWRHDLFDDLLSALRAIDWHFSIFPATSLDGICLFKRPDNYRDRGGVGGQCAKRGLP